MKFSTVLTLTSVIFTSVLLCLVVPLAPAVAQLKSEFSLINRIPLNDDSFGLAFSPDGNTLAFSMRLNRIGLWDVRTGKQTATLQADIDAAVKNPEEHVPSRVEFSPDGRTLAALANANRQRQSNRLHLWDVRTGRHIATTETDGFFDLSFSPDGQTIVTGNSGWNSNAPTTDILHFWDAHTLQRTATLKHEVWGGHRVKFSPDGRIVVTVTSSDGTVNFWDAHTHQLMGSLEQKFQSLQELAFLPDGQTLIARYWKANNFVVDAWDVTTRQHIGTLSRGWQFAVSPVADILAAPDGPGVVSLWEVSTHQPQLILKFKSSDFLYAWSFAFSRDGQMLAVRVSEPDDREAIYLWKLMIVVDTTAIDIPDPNLRAKVADALGKASNAVITAFDMLALVELEAPNANIRNLTGLEYAYNLETLDLHNNSISDVSPLAGLTQLIDLILFRNNISDISTLSELTKLTRLSFSGNNISDISPLSELTKLTRLSFSGNNISDISTLLGLTQLTDLNLDNNNISDISLLSELTKLTVLTLSGNNISDISPLSELTKLTYLYISGTNISDISPLAGLTQLTHLILSDNNISDISTLLGLTQLTDLDLYYNHLNYAALYTHLPALQAEGVEVRFHERIPKTLLKISGTRQESIVNTALPLPFVVEVLDQTDRPFAGVPVKFAVASGSGKLSATTVTTDAIGTASTRLILGRTAGTTTVRVTAADISQSVQFTATAISSSSPVVIPDPNLRAKIMEASRKPHNETPIISDMLKLTTLNANSANISDLTGLQYAANLTRLSLNNNLISNISVLAALTQLTTVDLRNNKISDVQPLVDLTQLTGSKELQRLYLQGNPLNDISINTHIPMLQAAGIDVRFDSVSITQPRPIVVRLIYFLPNDRQPQPDIDATLDRFIKGVQQFYAEQMEAHQFGRKTFQIETDAQGKAVVHHIIGKFADAYYLEHGDIYAKAWTEVEQRFDTSRNVHLVVIDTSNQRIADFAAGIAKRGLVAIPASGPYFNRPLAAHELGHTFGLQHNLRSTDYVMSFGPWSFTQLSLSKCAAEVLEISPFFNPDHQSQSGNSDTTVKMHPPLAAPSLAIRLRFEVTDADGLYQVQLYGVESLIACKRLNGQTNTIVEFANFLEPRTSHIVLSTIDVHGNISFSEPYPIDVASLLPPSKTVTIPDTNLATAVRETLDLAPGTAITTHTMLNLSWLRASNRGITDLTGLEHARFLRDLNLGDAYNPNEENVAGWDYWVNSNSISDLSPLAGLTQLTSLQLENNAISDVSPLATLTQLDSLDLGDNAISDVSPLAILTKLTELNLSSNPISDVSSLATLTQLRSLQFYNCETISDVSGLATLTQLQMLDLSDNAISDVSSLTTLTKLTELSLSANTISDISPLTTLTQLEVLRLWNNNISDVSGLATLTQLRSLWLSGNAVADISPLVALDLLGTKSASTALDLRWNPLSYTSVNTYIPTIQAKGIEVKFENRAYSALLKVSGDAQNSAAGADLTTPFVVEVVDASGKPMQGVPVTFAVTAGGGRLNTKTTETNARGRAQTILTLGQRPGRNTVRATAERIPSFAVFNANGTEASSPLAADVNGDGMVNIQDLVLVSSRLGQVGQNAADVNRDGTVNIQDLVLVAGELGTEAAAPSAWHRTSAGVPSREKVGMWLTQAQHLALTDARSQRGILLLERLLAALAPKETILLANYPNPFNPETWIPYHLTEPADVTLTIYAADGKVVRRLDLGYRAAGYYQNKARAAYWDGRNNVGERVASGLYFYTLTADDFTTTRKMLIRK